MTSVRNPSDNLDIVIEYLESHPDFFLDKPELLSIFNIPEDLGHNIHSLIEYQVNHLRKQKKTLTDKLKYFQSTHQTVFELSEATYSQQEDLLSINTIEELYDSFYQFLNKHYAVNYLLFFVFMNNRTQEDYKGLRFRKSTSKVQQLFIGLFNHNKPLCDCLQNDYLEFLFGKKAKTISSSAVFPIQSDNPRGLMVIASRDADQYEHGLALNLLNQLKSVFIFRLLQLLWG